MLRVCAGIALLRNMANQKQSIADAVESLREYLGMRVVRQFIGGTTVIGFLGWWYKRRHPL